MVEQFILASWEEHERPHARLTERDLLRIQAVRALGEPGTEAQVVHWTQVTPGRPA